MNRSVRLTSSITGKLILWWLCFILVLNGSLIVIYTNIRQMMKISTEIVTRHNPISSASERMIEALLFMEETREKYTLLEKESYVEQFGNSKNEFFMDLVRAINSSKPDSESWERIYDEFKSYNVINLNADDPEAGKQFWIQDDVINQWIDTIWVLRLENESRIVDANLELHRWGNRALQSGLIAVGVFFLLGVLGILFLSKAIIGPIKTLVKGLQSISKQHPQRLIEYHKTDEFGQLADAFNNMADRLQHEEKMRTDFIATLSHEIRSPLTSILESVNLIEEGLIGPVNAQQRKFLEIAANEIDRVVDLLNHLLQVSHFEKGDLEIDHQKIDTGEFIPGCIEFIAPHAKTKNISITSSIPTDMPEVLADPERLRQIMDNLLGNAVKFSPPNGRVQVEAGFDHALKKIWFAIKDEGPGIEPSDAKHIFDKYYRGKNGRRQVDGVGLGLSISKLIVEAHGGRIWLKSQVGQGSTFGFDLPMMEGHRLGV